MTAIAVAAISARVLAEAAAREEFKVIALDLFGDADTCRAASRWLPIGEAGSLRIDAPRLLAALETLAQQGEVQGWVAGAGFEGQPELLAQGAARLPLIGTAPADVRRLRQPTTFFGFLKACGIGHPAVRHDRGGGPAGWLVKDAGGCGGWHIVRTADRAAAHATPLQYLQRESRGVPMSVTFIANGSEAVVLGFNEQIVRPIRERPFVYHGVIGPLPVAEAARRDLTAALRALTESFALRGLGSLDFLLDGERVHVLEVNPRPPASMELYPRVGATGVLRAHLRACRNGVLPAVPEPDGQVRGSEIVYAPHALQLDAALSGHFASRLDAHDLPHPGAQFAAGDPVCSVSANGADARAVKIELTRRRDALLHHLESLR